jgi:hypothetical protein
VPGPPEKREEACEKSVSPHGYSFANRGRLLKFPISNVKGRMKPGCLPKAQAYAQVGRAGAKPGYSYV